MKSLIIRTASGVVIVLLTVLAIITGKSSLAFYVFLLSIIGIREFYMAVANKNIYPVKIIGYISCIGFLLNGLNYSWASSLNIFLFALVGLLLSVFIIKGIGFIDAAVTIFGIFYIPFLFQHIIYLDSKIYVALIFMVSWGTDTFAYVFGCLFGKHKLCPKLSPKKTIEGSIGGILGSIVLVFLLATYFKLKPLWFFIVIALTGSIIAQIGDLTASKIKRLTGIKDFGFIMPGHGGILDRFDSILFVATYTYYLLKIFYN
ncbi:MAG: phosphatidate cytidylyltransferase [Tissierellia bacterium]|nr:phosphatidate cytidylyltransferase [Tissierellia bacterium]